MSKEALWREWEQAGKEADEASESFQRLMESTGWDKRLELVGRNKIILMGNGRLIYVPGGSMSAEAMATMMDRFKAWAEGTDPLAIFPDAEVIDNSGKAPAPPLEVESLP